MAYSQNTSKGESALLVPSSVFSTARHAIAESGKKNKVTDPSYAKQKSKELGRNEGCSVRTTISLYLTQDLFRLQLNFSQPVAFFVTTDLCPTEP